MSGAPLLGPIDPLGRRSILVPPPPVHGDPAGLRAGARQLEKAAADLDSLVLDQRVTVFELTTTGGWTGPAANTFEDRAAEPVCRALSGIARELERVASALRRGATTIEEAQFEHRRAEEMAIAAGVGVALTLLTFAISDVFAADAAAGAAALMVRAAAAAARASRAVAAAMEEADAAIGVLSARLATMGQTMLLGLSASLPRLMESPAFAGIWAAADTAAVGDRHPEDLLQALAMGYLEGKAGEAAETRSPSIPVTGRALRVKINLQAIEGVEGAHVIRDHVGKTDQQLADRGLRRAATFPDTETADWAVQAALDANRARIAEWLRSRSSRQLDPPIVFDTRRPVGRVLTRDRWLAGKGTVETTVVRVVLRRSTATPLGYVTYTAFPDLL